MIVCSNIVHVTLIPFVKTSKVFVHHRKTLWIRPTFIYYHILTFPCPEFAILWSLDLKLFDIPLVSSRMLRFVQIETVGIYLARSFQSATFHRRLRPCTASPLTRPVLPSAITFQSLTIVVWMVSLLQVIFVRLRLVFPENPFLNINRLIFRD